MTRTIPQIRSLPYEQRLEILGLTSLKARRQRGVLIQFFKIHRNINNVNWLKRLTLLPSTLTDSPAGSTRGHSHRLHIEKTSTCTPLETFFTNRTIPMWNSLTPYSCRCPQPQRLQEQTWPVFKNQALKILFRIWLIWFLRLPGFNRPPSISISSDFSEPQHYNSGVSLGTLLLVLLYVGP